MTNTENTRSTTTLEELAAERRATEAARVATHNAKIAATMAAAKADRGFAVAVTGSGTATHAARGIVRGHSGYNHPRPLCQPASPRHYSHLLTDQAGADVTCRRCIASLEAGR